MATSVDTEDIRDELKLYLVSFFEKFKCDFHLSKLDDVFSNNNNNIFYNYINIY